MGPRPDVDTAVLAVLEGLQSKLNLTRMAKEDSMQDLFAETTTLILAASTTVVAAKKFLEEVRDPESGKKEILFPVLTIIAIGMTLVVGLGYFSQVDEIRDNLQLRTEGDDSDGGTNRKPSIQEVATETNLSLDSYQESIVKMRETLLRLGPVDPGAFHPDKAITLRFDERDDAGLFVKSSEQRREAFLQEVRDKLNGCTGANPVVLILGLADRTGSHALNTRVSNLRAGAAAALLRDRIGQPIEVLEASLGATLAPSQQAGAIANEVKAAYRSASAEILCSFSGRISPAGLPGPSE